jgi:hypothetical protein
MPNRFITKRIITKDQHGLDHYAIEVSHAPGLEFAGNIGDLINYISTGGLTLLFKHVAVAPPAPTKKISSFKLGIDGNTFSGTGTFTLNIRYRLDGEDEEDPVTILRSDGLVSNPDTKPLVAQYADLRVV